MCVCVCLVGWLPGTRPLSGPRRRWRDLVKCEMRVVGLGNEDWFSAAQDMVEGCLEAVTYHATFKQQKIYEGHQLRRMYIVKCVSNPSAERVKRLGIESIAHFSHLRGHVTHTGSA